MIFSHPFRRASALIPLAALVAALLGACASDTTRQAASRPASGEAEMTLQEGIRLYEEGRYDVAQTRLRKAIDLGLNTTGNAVQAHKHLAFILCVSGETGACAIEFGELLKIEPRFELGKAEAGHPMWGPVFNAVKLRAEAGGTSK